MTTESPAPSTGLLECLRVVEIGRRIAAPIAGVVLEVLEEIGWEGKVGRRRVVILAQSVRDPSQVGCIVEGIVRSGNERACVAGPREDVAKWLDHTGVARETGRDPLAASAKGFRRRPIPQWQRSIGEAGLEHSVAMLPQPKLTQLISAQSSPGSNSIPQIRKRGCDGFPSKLNSVCSPIEISLTPIADISPPPMHGADKCAIPSRIDEDLPVGALTPLDTESQFFPTARHLAPPAPTNLALGQCLICGSRSMRDSSSSTGRGPASIDEFCGLRTICPGSTRVCRSTWCTTSCDLGIEA